MSAKRMVPVNGQDTWVTAMKYILGRKRAEEALGFLAEVSKVMASSLDYSSTVVTVTGLVVPFLADWCSVDLLSQDGSACQLAVAVVDQVDQKLAEQFDTFFRPCTPSHLDGIPQVLLTGRSETYSLSAAGMKPEAHGPQEVLSRLGLTAAMAVPITARQELFGSISLVALERVRGRCYGHADLALAEELARRLASGIEIGQLHHKLRKATAARILP